MENGKSQLRESVNAYQENVDRIYELQHDNEKIKFDIVQNIIANDPKLLAHVSTLNMRKLWNIVNR